MSVPVRVRPRAPLRTITNRLWLTFLLIFHVGSMTITDGIMITSALIVTIGWFVTGHLARKNEITKERRSYRLDMLHSFYPIIFFIQEKNYVIGSGQEKEKLQTLLGAARPKFLLYGYNDEIDAYENVVEAFLPQQSG